MTAASKSGMSQELIQQHARIRMLGEDLGKLEAKVNFLYYLFAASILLTVALTYVNYRAIRDCQDQSHMHPR